jgi:hypothetical protein
MRLFFPYSSCSIGFIIVERGKLGGVWCRFTSSGNGTPKMLKEKWDLAEFPAE